MREWMTTWLDVLGLVLVGAGAAAGMYPLIGWAGLAAAGGVILGGSSLAARQGTAVRKRGDGT
ncbi:hypothetical protein [Streptomyces sp. NPDC058620]|uniref:hypothetical protein n=1 Tax=Streptomyces sp. NPDC058620 TaxID=3346560 RepID=UPI00365D4B73